MTIQEAIEYLEEQGYTVVAGGEGEGHFILDPATGQAQYAATERELIAFADEVTEAEWDAYIAATYPWWDAKTMGEFPEPTYGTKKQYDPESRLMVDVEVMVDDGSTKALGIANFVRLQEDPTQGKIVAGPSVGAPEGTWWNVSPTGVITEWTPEKEPVEGQVYDTYQEAAANVPPGFKPVQRTDGTWGFAEKPRRSLDQIIEDLIVKHDVDEANYLYTTWQQMTRPKGLTPDQAASYIMGLPIAPDEMEEWIGALTDDWNAPRTPQERVAPPTREFFAPQQPPTAAERNAMPFQAPVPMGAGIPAGLAGAGAGGLQFPDWMTKPGGMPPSTGAQAGLTPEQKAALGRQEAEIEEQGGGGQLTDEEIEARRGVFGGAPATTPTTKAVFDPVAAALAQTYPDMDSAYKVGVEMQSRTGKQYRVVQKEGGYGLIEAPAPGQPVTGLGGTPPLFKAAGITGEELARQNAGAQGGIEATIPQWLLPPNVPEEPQEGGIWPAARDETERQKRARGLPYITGAGYTFIPTMQYGEDRTPPASSALFYPGAAVYELTDEERARANAQAAQRQVFSPPSPSLTPKALWKRGEQATFEQQLFGRPSPLSPQEALLQAKYRKWSKERQRVFESQPMKRTVFK